MSNGHIEVIKYLHDIFGLEKIDAQSDNDYALHWAQRNGHNEVVDYLHNSFGL